MRCGGVPTDLWNQSTFRNTLPSNLHWHIACSLLDFQNQNARSSTVRVKVSVDHQPSPQDRARNLEIQAPSQAHGRQALDLSCMPERPLVLVPYDLGQQPANVLVGRELSSRCYFFHSSPRASSEDTLQARVRRRNESIATDGEAADCYLTSDKAENWQAFNAQGQHLQLILYSPPKLQKHHLWALKPLQLDSEQYIPGYEFQDVLVARNIERAHRLALHQQEGLASLDMQHLLSAVNQTPSTVPSTKQQHIASLFLAVFEAIVLCLQPLSLLLQFLTKLWSARLLLGNGFKDLSATVQQLDVRAQQMQAAPAQLRLAHALSSEQDLYQRRSQYVRLYTTIWLVLNDVIVGTAVSTLLAEHSDKLAAHAKPLVQQLAVTDMKAALLWLNAWPLGLKLNTELGSFFCDAFLFFLGAWNRTVIKPLLQQLPLVMRCVAWSACGGATLPLACLSDFISLCSFHLWLFYIAATAIYSWHLSVLYALFNIFRGKKYNVLRQRLEPATYELDRLLLGTILFTLAAFLLPTVLAFYLLFAAARVVVLSLHALIEVWLALLNHFPLFALMLRLKDPGRLPAGLQFDVLPSGLLLLRSRPMDLSDIFEAFASISLRIYRHYSPAQMVIKVCKGKLILPIPRFQLQPLQRETE